MFARLEHENANGSGQQSQEAFFVVSDEVELSDFGAAISFPAVPVILDVDISDSQILITAVADQPLAFREFIILNVLGDEAPLVAGATVNPATTWAGFSQLRVNVISQNIFVNLASLTALEGQQILLDVIPEPSSAGLALTCLATLALGRRGR
jgi:hypothetical protein